jgi:acyl carrier protein
MDQLDSASRTEVERMHAWLVELLANVFELPADQIKSDVSLFDHGIDSQGAVALAEELEKFVGIEVPLSIVWDYPTIDELSCQMAILVENAAATPRAGDDRLATTQGQLDERGTDEGHVE